MNMYKEYVYKRWAEKKYGLATFTCPPFITNNAEE
jgi:hypothetical protein